MKKARFFHKLLSLKEKFKTPDTKMQYLIYKKFQKLSSSWKDETKI